jgi:signal transduction histidine kinase
MDVRSNRFFEPFSQASVERIVPMLIVQEVADGDYLFHEGDRAIGICLVLTGQIETLRRANGHEQILNVYGPSDFLGDVAVLDGHGRSADARATVAATIAWLPSDDLHAVLESEPVSVTLALVRNVVALLRRTNELYLNEVVHKEKLALVGEMAGSLMHDLRNPVQVIVSTIELLKLIHPDKETTELATKMESQCNRLISMAGELLDFSRGEPQLHLERTDTQSLIHRFLTEIEEAARPAGVTITAETEPAAIEVDAMRLLRAMQNLVGNAVQALRDRENAAVHVRAWVAESVLNISVRDNGPGIPPEFRTRIFQPFATFGKSGGTGLGLAIVLSVVEAHRGKITVETTEGSGTEFLLRLPQNTTAPSVT